MNKLMKKKISYSIKYQGEQLQCKELADGNILEKKLSSISKSHAVIFFDASHNLVIATNNTLRVIFQICWR